jgi:flagellar biosynthesis GTPase FlhF
VSEEEYMFFRKYFLTKPLLEADGGQGGGGSGSGTAGADDEGTAGSGSVDGQGGEGAEEEKSFDDVLKDTKYQSEFDKRIAKAIETAKAKWDTDYNAKLEEAKTEAQKLAKMTADQKSEYEKQKHEDELTKREKDISARELKAQAYETLAEKGIPKELADILNYESADTCSTSIKSVEKAFQAAVEKAVNEKLRSKETPRGGSGAGGSDAALRKAFGL